MTGESDHLSLIDVRKESIYASKAFLCICSVAKMVLFYKKDTIMDADANKRDNKKTLLIIIAVTGEPENIGLVGVRPAIWVEISD